MSTGGVEPAGTGTGPQFGRTYVARHFAVSGEEFRRAAGWLMFLGIVLIVLGTLAIIVPLIATLSFMLFFGWLLLFAGVFQVVAAFATRLWGGFFLHLLMGIIDVVLGLIFIRHPGLAAEVVTLFLIAGFIVGGVFRLVAAFSMRFPNWGWTALSGAVTLALGIWLWAWFPPASLFIPGLYIGIQMLFYGWSAVMLSAAARSHRGTAV